MLMIARHSVVAVFSLDLCDLFSSVFLMILEAVLNQVIGIVKKVSDLILIQLFSRLFLSYELRQEKLYLPNREFYSCSRRSNRLKNR